MSQLTLATQFAEAVYLLQPTHIEIVPPFFDWRGLYRVHDTLGRIWILRLLQLPTARNALAKTAHLLHWLERQQYPAPRLALTRDQQHVGFLDGWSSLLLSYIDGAVLDVQSPDFAQLGYTLGQLHTVPRTNDARFPRSRCDPMVLQTQTAQQLAHAHARVAPSFHALITALHNSLIPLTAPEHPLCLTHGDCWYKNAIKTATDAVVLIDWDCGGIGLPILDLGFLLLTAHYDFAQPFHIAVDAHKIRAIMQGYQRARQITREENAHMESAVQFVLAFQVGEHVTEQPSIASDDLFLQKVRVRFAASTEIAHLAQQALL